MRKMGVLMRASLVALSLAIVCLVGTWLAGAAPPVMAQEATPAAVELSPLLQAWVDAFNANDSAAVAALYTEDGVVENVPSGMVVQGRDQIQEMARQSGEGLSDFQLDVIAAHESEDFAVLEYVFTATEEGADAPLTIRGAYVFEIDGDLISRTADYYDTTGILVQLGLIDMDAIMAGMATPTP